MAELRCVDGSVLAVRPVPVVGRDGTPYEVTLDLLRNGEPFGDVGERCGYFVAATAEAIRTAGPGDFPPSSAEVGVRAWAVREGVDADPAWATLQRHLPRDRELFCFRSRDPDDLGSVGELRVTLEEERTWLPATDDRGGAWRVDCCAVLQAWGSGGLGVRAVLSSEQLLAFLDALLAECAAAGVSYSSDEDSLPAPDSRG